MKENTKREVIKDSKGRTVITESLKDGKKIVTIQDGEKKETHLEHGVPVYKQPEQ